MTLVQRPHSHLWMGGVLPVVMTGAVNALELDGIVSLLHSRSSLLDVSRGPVG